MSCVLGRQVPLPMLPVGVGTSISKKQNEHTDERKSKEKGFLCAWAKPGGNELTGELGMLLHGAEPHSSALLQARAEIPRQTPRRSPCDAGSALGSSCQPPGGLVAI